MYWKGKTYYVYAQLYHAISRWHNPYVIGNIPYSQVDLFWSSPDELSSVIQLLSDYIRHTNVDHRIYFDHMDQQRDIIVVIDEAHLSFNARDRAKVDAKMSSLLVALSQCRKRKIKFIVISQKTSLIDKTFRICADFTVKMDEVNIILGTITKARTYVNPGDIMDVDTNMITIGDEWLISRRSESLLVDSNVFFSMSDYLDYFNRFFSWRQRLNDEKYNTVYVTGFSDTARAIPQYSCYFDRDGYQSWYDDLFDGHAPIIPYPQSYKWRDSALIDIPKITPSKSDSEQLTNYSITQVPGRFKNPPFS